MIGRKRRKRVEGGSRIIEAAAGERDVSHRVERIAACRRAGAPICRHDREVGDRRVCAMRGLFGHAAI